MQKQQCDGYCNNIKTIIQFRSRSVFMLYFHSESLNPYRKKKNTQYIMQPSGTRKFRRGCGKPSRINAFFPPSSLSKRSSEPGRITFPEQKTREKKQKKNHFSLLYLSFLNFAGHGKRPRRRLFRIVFFQNYERLKYNCERPDENYRIA